MQPKTPSPTSLSKDDQEANLTANPGKKPVMLSEELEKDSKLQALAKDVRNADIADKAADYRDAALDTNDRLDKSNKTKAELAAAQDRLSAATDHAADAADPNATIMAGSGLDSCLWHKGGQVILIPTNGTTIRMSECYRHI